MKTVLILMGALFAIAGPVRAEAAMPLRLIATVPLEGVEGRFDHMSVDSSTDRLYVAALGNNTVEAINIKTGMRAGSIERVREPQGIVVVPETHTIVVASGGDGSCRFYDPALTSIGVLTGLGDADNVRYDPRRKRVYAGYGNGALAVIDPMGPVKEREIQLDGHPESFQLEEDGDRIFVNVPAARRVIVIRQETGQQIAEWPLEGAEANFPMALDEKDHRLFVGCRTPARLLIIDTESGKTVAAMDCCGDADDVFYDAERRRIYVSGGEGSISVIDQVDGDRYKFDTAVPTAPGARTSFFNAAAGMLYVAVPHHDGQRAEIRMYEATAR